MPARSLDLRINTVMLGISLESFYCVVKHILIYIFIVMFRIDNGYGILS